MERSNKPCPIWGDIVPPIKSFYDENGSLVMRSPRTGGDYRLDAKAVSEVLTLADETDKAKLTTILIDLRRAGDHAPWVTCDLVEKARRADPLAPYVRAERLLRYLMSKQESVGRWIETLPTYADPLAFAWSESTEPEDITYFLNYLTRMKWLDRFKESDGLYKVSVPGYEHIAEQARQTDSSQCFVAMWFNPETDAAYKDGIKKAVDACGYKPLPINKKPDVIKIDDEIIAEIRRSRFVVADFTHDPKTGARGGVYFEAGFAHGLGRPVIYSCKKGLEEKLHFDTRQYYHILWQTPADLCTELQKRILAIVGEGPKAHATDATSE